MTLDRVRRIRKGERGAAAIEAATITAFFLVPLMVGVLSWGYYLWMAQKAPTLDPNLDQSGLVGSFCTNQVPDLLTRVRDAALVAAENLDTGDSLPVSSSDVVAEVVSYVPGELGVVVSVSFTVDVVNNGLDMIPLPHGGKVTTESQLQLENVLITVASC